MQSPDSYQEEIGRVKQVRNDEDVLKSEEELMIETGHITDSIDSYTLSNGK